MTTRLKHPPGLVTASAGTGKTYWIVEQVQRLLEGGASLDQIGVITFGEKAAAELRERIALALKTARHPAADQVAGAPISTIHGFALGLLQRHGLVAGRLAPETTLDQAQSESLLRQALSEALEDPIFKPATALLKEALQPRNPEDIGAAVFRLMECARSMRVGPGTIDAQAVTNRAFLASAFGEPGDAAALDAELTRAFDVLDGQLSRPPSAKGDVALVEDFDRALKALKQGQLRKAAAVERKLAGSTKGLAPTLLPALNAARRWLRFHPLQLAYMQEVSDAMFGLAGQALARYEQRKSVLGCLDFSDQVAEALTLLERNLDGQPLAAYVARELPYLLIDEFQDTSPLQFRLAELLRDQGCQVWYVGDLKQAIFGWRDADSRLMGALNDQAEAAGRVPHALAQNWRSRAELVAFANDLFAPVFKGCGLTFTPVTAASKHLQQENLPAGPVVELVMKKSYYPKANEILPRLQALYATGREIFDRAEAVMRPLAWRDVAVLARTNAQLDEWAVSLEAAGIAYNRELDGWSGTAEVRGAIAWLRCLANPHDTQALADALCSDYFGLDPATLAVLASHRVFSTPGQLLQDSQSWQTLVKKVPDALQQRVLMRFGEAWKIARRELASNPLTLGIRRALDAMDAELRLLAYPDAPRRRANLSQLVEFAQKLEGTRTPSLLIRGVTGATLENFLAWLADVPETDLDRQPLARAAGSDAIQLLTIHRAKGLEFPLVVLSQLPLDITAHASRCEIAWPSAPDALLAPDLLERGQVRFVPPHPDVEDLRERLGQDQADTAKALDEACLLYVAVTRARDYLMLGWVENPRAHSSQALLGVGVVEGHLAGHPVLVSQCGAVADGPRDLADKPGPWRERCVPIEPAPTFWVHEQRTVPPAVPLPPLKWETHRLAASLGEAGRASSKELGLAVHAALRLADLCGSGLPDDVLFERLGRRWEAPLPALAIEAVGLTRNLLAHFRATAIYREIACVVGGEEEAETLRLDALLETPTGPIVLEYKTDRCEADELVARHTAQLEAYGVTLTKLSGTAPRLVLVGLGSGQWVELLPRHA